MIIIIPEYIRKLGDLPKEEFIPDPKLELYIKFANVDFQDTFDTFEYENDEMMVDMAQELKGRFALIHAVPNVNALYIDGYAKYTEQGTLESRFYSPKDVANLMHIHQTRVMTLINMINKRIATLESETSDPDILKDKSGISLTVLGGNDE